MSLEAASESLEHGDCHAEYRHIFAGVLAIYGTTNALVIVYPIAGGLLMLLSLASLTVGKRRGRQPVENYDTAV